MALSLQQEQQSQDLQWEQLPEGISDLELAKKLQEEEDRRASQYYQEQEQEQAAAAQAQVGGERREWCKDYSPASACFVFFVFFKECSHSSPPLTWIFNPGSVYRDIRCTHLLI